MKEINRYYKSFSETNKKSDYLKYGLLNEYGPSLDESNKEVYNEEEIMKRK